MFGLSVIDLVVIAIYFAVVIAIGIWSMRKIKNQEDYFLAGRSFGKFVYFLDRWPFLVFNTILL